MRYNYSDPPTLPAAVAKLEREKLTRPFAIFGSIDDDALGALLEDFETQKSVVRRLSGGRI